MTRAVIDFLWCYFAVMIVVGVVEAIAGISLGQGATIGATFAGAMVAGHLYARRHRVDPGNGFKWQAALAMTASSFLIGLALFAVLVSLEGESLGAVIGALTGGGVSVVMLVVMAAILALIVAITRWAFGLGITQQLKTQPGIERTFE